LDADDDDEDAVDTVDTLQADAGRLLLLDSMAGCSRFLLGKKDVIILLLLER
jgi:hypothetical protein